MCSLIEDGRLLFAECFLPLTFQSLFTGTNLHIWMLTVRLRTLPLNVGKPYQQALIGHFFIDIEDRILTVLQPPSEPQKPYTFESAFYTNPNKPLPGEGKTPRWKTEDPMQGTGQAGQ